jgi:arylsulfatase A-like enzyme
MSKRPHLILLCIDSLRADVREDSPVWESCGGRPRTPGLDALAAESISWRRAYAASSWTKPSVPSMLLSCFPAEHGVYEVSKDVDWTTAFTAPLPEDVPTLAETLREAGYRTAALAHNAQLDPSLGFSRGFDTFLSDAGSGKQILDRLEALDPWTAPDRRPAFVYLHLIEPHWPFGPDIARRAKDAAAGRFPFHTFRASQWKALKHDLKKRRVELEDDEIGFLRATYRAAVEEADLAVVRFVEELRRSDVLEDSILVVTADHGEELLDHGLVGHGQSLHEELIRVPLLVRVGSRTGVETGLPAETDELASLIDVAPSLMAAAGIVASHARGRDVLRDPAPGRVFAEVKHKRRYLQAVVEDEFKLVREYRFARRPQTEASSDYNNLPELFADRAYRTEARLFDLRRDPGETTDLARVRSDVRREAESTLDHWWQGLSRRTSSTRAIEDDMIRRLEALGYL